MIGDVLVAARAITQEQLERAREIQRSTGGPVGDALVAIGAVTEAALAEALAREARVGFASLDGAEPDADSAARLPERLARGAVLVPIAPRGAARARVAQADPFDVVATDEAQRALGAPVEVVCAPRSAILRLIDAAYGPRAGSRLRALADEAAASLGAAADAEPLEASPVVRLADALLDDAVASGATDLHLEPDESAVRVRHRVDGVLREADALPRGLQAPVVSRLKVMAGLDIAEQRLPQEGRVTRTVDGRQMDFRVSCFPTVFGEKAAIRILEQEKLVRGLPDLGMNRRALGLFQDLLGRSRGIVLVTGPTGAGKTTTLYSALNALGGRARNIMTVEDPVEFEFPAIRQTQVRPRAGLTFAAAIRSMLRQDPDVIMVGEIRDPETAELAVRAALSGVLVFSTLHTQDAAGAVPRLMDMGVEPYLLASTMAGVVAQRLVRLVCQRCKAPASYPAASLARAGLSHADGVAFVKGAGCEDCGGSGYRGRTGVFEILMIDAAMRELISARADSRRIRDTAARAGFKPIGDDALSKAVLGQTTLEEVIRVSSE
ncbi:MAG TPA: GspE/PulE family protein [Vicinamibacterales bacterium]|nr:GspE/PulE family protein [Vicinamibacterales bacterium]